MSIQKLHAVPGILHVSAVSQMRYTQDVHFAAPFLRLYSSLMDILHAL